MHANVRAPRPKGWPKRVRSAVIQIKDARTGRIRALRRPLYPPIERLAILELRAARGWSMSQTARRLLVTAVSLRPSDWIDSRRGWPVTAFFSEATASV